MAPTPPTSPTTYTEIVRRHGSPSPSPSPTPPARNNEGTLGAANATNTLHVARPNLIRQRRGTLCQSITWLEAFHCEERLVNDHKMSMRFEGAPLRRHCTTDGRIAYSHYETLLHANAPETITSHPAVTSDGASHTSHTVATSNPEQWVRRRRRSVRV